MKSEICDQKTDRNYNYLLFSMILSGYSYAQCSFFYFYLFTHMGQVINLPASFEHCHNLRLKFGNAKLCTNEQVIWEHSDKILLNKIVYFPVHCSSTLSCQLQSLVCFYYDSFSGTNVLNENQEIKSFWMKIKKSNQSSIENQGMTIRNSKKTTRRVWRCLNTQYIINLQYWHEGPMHESSESSKTPDIMGSKVVLLKLRCETHS